MESELCYGVDVSAETLDIARVDDDQVLTLRHQVAAVRAWFREIAPGALIGVESTGTLHRVVVREAIAAGHRVYLLNPRDLSHYARALGRRAKTDRLDAQLIARYLSHEHPHLHPYRLPTAQQEQLDELIRRRHKVVVAQQSLRQSLKGMKLSGVSKTHQAMKDLIGQIDRKLAQMIAQDPALAPIAKRLTTVVGFGPLLSASLAQALTRHPFASSDAFVAFIGYDPRPRDSGQKRGRRFLSKRGPAVMRRLLFNAAMSASKTKTWQPFYQRYRARGLPTTAALVILARKLARVAFSITKHETNFNPRCVQIA